MIGSSMGCARPDGAELTSGLAVGMQSCSAPASVPLMEGPGDSDGMSTMQLRSHSAAPGPHRLLLPGASGGRVFTAAGLEGQQAGLGRVTFGGGINIQAKSWGQLRSIKSSKVAASDTSRETPTASKGAW